MITVCPLYENYYAHKTKLCEFYTHYLYHKRHLLATIDVIYYHSDEFIMVDHFPFYTATLFVVGVRSYSSKSSKLLGDCSAQTLATVCFFFLNVFEESLHAFN